MKITPIQVTIADLTKTIKTMETAVYSAMMTILRLDRLISVSSFTKISREI